MACQSAGSRCRLGSGLKTRPPRHLDRPGHIEVAEDHFAQAVSGLKILKDAVQSARLLKRRMRCGIFAMLVEGTTPSDRRSRRNGRENETALHLPATVASIKFSAPVRFFAPVQNGVFIESPR